jgi:hypothetical protein
MPCHVSLPRARQRNGSEAERLLGLIARTSRCQIRIDPSSVMVQPGWQTFKHARAVTHSLTGGYRADDVFGDWAQPA